MHARRRCGREEGARCDCTSWLVAANSTPSSVGDGERERASSNVKCEDVRGEDVCWFVWVWEGGGVGVQAGVMVSICGGEGGVEDR